MLNWIRLGETAPCHGVDIHNDSPPQSYGTRGANRNVSKGTSEPHLEDCLKTRPRSVASNAALLVGYILALSPVQSLVRRQDAWTAGPDLNEMGTLM